MFKKTIGLIAAGLITTGAMGGLALAEGPGGPDGRAHRGGPGHGPPPIIHVLRGLELDESQEAMLKDFKTEAKAEREAKRDEVEGIRDAMKAELVSGNPNSNALHGYIDELEAIKSEGAHRMMDDFLALYGTLTPEQLDDLQERLENPPERGRGGPDGRSRRAKRGGPDKEYRGKGKWDRSNPNEE